MKFSIITVSYNSGNKIAETVETVLHQTCHDYEIIIKDGDSKDGSIIDLAALPEIQTAVKEGRIKIIQSPDKGVYDAMNQAIRVSEGDYLIFLNCGDGFANEEILEHTALKIEREHKTSESYASDIYYGDTFCRSTGTEVPAAPRITGFTCYRNIPCHQSCFYGRHLFEEKRYDLSLLIRADYDHFLWCYYVKKCNFHYLHEKISYYEGGGISEIKENAARDQKEHKIVTKRYMSTMELFKYKLILTLTLVHLRRFIASHQGTSKIYEALKRAVYKMKKAQMRSRTKLFSG